MVDVIQASKKKISLMKTAAEVKQGMPSPGLLEELAEFFKVFGDATRIKILCALFSSPLKVHELSDVLGMTQSSVSHQLRTLKNMRIVRHRKEGQAVSYSLDDEHIKKIFDDGFFHVTEGRKGTF